jgi:hypothetical protein
LLRWRLAGAGKPPKLAATTGASHSQEEAAAAASLAALVGGPGPLVLHHAATLARCVLRALEHASPLPSSSRGSGSAGGGSGSRRSSGSGSGGGSGHNNNADPCGPPVRVTWLGPREELGCMPALVDEADALLRAAGCRGIEWVRLVGPDVPRCYQEEAAAGAAAEGEGATTTATATVAGGGGALNSSSASSLFIPHPRRCVHPSSRLYHELPAQLSSHALCSGGGGGGSSSGGGGSGSDGGNNNNNQQAVHVFFAPNAGLSASPAQWVPTLRRIARDAAANGSSSGGGGGVGPAAAAPPPSTGDREEGDGDDPSPAKRAKKEQQVAVKEQPCRPHPHNRPAPTFFFATDHTEEAALRAESVLRGALAQGGAAAYFVWPCALNPVRSPSMVAGAGGGGGTALPCCSNGWVMGAALRGSVFVLQSHTT